MFFNMVFKCLLSWLRRGLDGFGGWGLLGVGRVWVMGGGSLNSFLFSFIMFFFIFLFLFLFFSFLFLFLFFLRCGFLLQIPHIQQTSLYTKNKNSPEYGDFNLSWSGLQLHQNLKPITKLFCTDFNMYT